MRRSGRWIGSPNEGGGRVNLPEFFDRFGAGLAAVVARAFPPIYDAETRHSGRFDLHRLRRRPLGGQADAIRATALSLQRHPGTLIVGEMGVGKSFVAAAAAYLAGHRTVLVVCPPHLVRKWQREILQTVPGARVTIVRTVSELERSRQLGGSVQFVVCSREQAKLGYRWKPAVIARYARDGQGRLVRDEAGAIVRALCCPACFAPLRDDEDIPLSWTELATKRQRCRACGGTLWQADRTGPRRFPLADYVRQRMAAYFDLLIADEMHEYKARGSAQGLAAGALAGACRTTLTLTGTLFGGYSSTLFYLLHRFSPAIRAEFGYHDEAKWVSRYGIVERITKKDPDAYTEDGRQTKRRGYLTRTVEKPGVVPAILFHLIGNTVFLRLSDVARNLPPYTERVALYPLDRGEGPSAPSQANCYERLASDLRQAVLTALHEGSKRLLGTYLQALLAYPDGCTHGETVRDPRTGAILATVLPLPEDVLYPKERALLELVGRERTRGRRVWLYLTHTDSRDLTPRLRTILEGAGVRVAVLKAVTVSADRREEWVAARVREGVDVVMSHPRLVQTGLDLLDFPSLVWYEPDYSVYTVRQASRRSWRIGQHEPVEVTFLVYEQTLQADALGLIAAKVRSALTIEGELPEDGLAALEGENHDVFLALARRLTEPSGAEDQSLEELFASVRQIEAKADDYLVDAVWIDPPIAAPMAGPAPVISQDDIGTWQSVFDRPAEDMSESVPTTAIVPAIKLITFDELARLVQRPRTRRKAAPSDQLALFER